MNPSDTVAGARPSWRRPLRPAEGAPNIVVVVLDDLGWSDLGCFGSEIATPAIDGLAASGLRFTDFHVTPLCSPTRASLLTGIGHHRLGMRFLAIGDGGFENARGRLPDDIETVPGRLRRHGYGTYLVGKWHLAPQEELTPAGPHGNWPLARGFERFYGFLGGASDQYAPELYRDNSPAPVPVDPGYHLSTDLVDAAIGYLADHRAYRPGDPFYLQVAFGATHAPFQAPAESIEPYRGRYAAGWDRLREERLVRQQSLGVVPPGTRLTEHDPAVPDWEGLSGDERRVAASGQEAFAGFLSHADAQLGRLLDWLSDAGILDETLVVVLADNGAAGDGGRIGTGNVIAPYNRAELPLDAEVAATDRFGDAEHPAHYAMGWAMAGNTPFRLYKQYVDLGGIRAPLIVHWPARIPDPGAVRHQYGHVTDLAASLLEAALPSGVPDGLDGRSLLPAIVDGGVPSPRSTQVYEMVGHRAIWHRGWKATTRHLQGADYSDDVWRLYDTARDFSEATDLATDHPARLAELVAMWKSLAPRHALLPLDDRSLKQILEADDPNARPPLDRIVLRPGCSHLGFTTRLTGTNRSMLVTARLMGRSVQDEGVLVASGTRYGGWTLYVLDQDLVFEHLFLGARVTVRATTPVPVGDASVGFRLERGEGAEALVTLVIDRADSGSVTVPRTSQQLAFYGLDVGHDPVSQVSAAYRGPFPFPTPALQDVVLQFAAPAAELSAEDISALAHSHEVNQ